MYAPTALDGREDPAMWSCAVHGAAWLVLYLLFILAPLFAMLAGTLPPAMSEPSSRSRWATAAWR